MQLNGSRNKENSLPELLGVDARAWLETCELIKQKGYLKFEQKVLRRVKSAAEFIYSDELFIYRRFFATIRFFGYDNLTILLYMSENNNLFFCKCRAFLDFFFLKSMVPRILISINFLPHIAIRAMQLSINIVHR